ncbi:hypothetical protein I592_04057 [Enterococcus gilvus ATCC BAA-350]|uniref:Uncharacterized protein n=1 Tax=Enterococcus gilvus ATCC BAA-350 TaxID=1158614 RepID=R2XF75_9ENTE|nr:hypothetical protein UKC_03967 [Enterococcus gilvus ATCC BAA-350]EOW78464.1 hypothetical protein I592_04057 [Enterococcus gilvus ATCC BAA-350]
MFKRYTKKFEQIILDLYNQGKNICQLSLEYKGTKNETNNIIYI